MKKLRSHTRDPDPRCLDGQNLGDSAVPVQPLKLLADLIEEVHVHLMVQKTVHLEDVAALNLSVLPDPILQKLHCSRSSVSILKSKSKITLFYSKIYQRSMKQM